MVVLAPTVQRWTTGVLRAWDGHFPQRYLEYLESERNLLNMRAAGVINLLGALFIGWFLVFRK
jgi:hypothetical protein